MVLWVVKPCSDVEVSNVPKGHVATILIFTLKMEAAMPSEMPQSTRP
jgi:hypothetical protein